MDKQQLCKQRDAITGRIQRIHAFIQQSLLDVSSVKRQHVEVRKKHLDSCWIELCDIQTKIEQVCKDDELGAEMVQRENDESVQFDLESQVEDLLSVLPISVASSDQGFAYVSSSKPATQVRLPQIDMPKFSGDYQEWTGFYDLFVSLVHNNIQLSPVQKLYYLKGSLNGEAKKLINSFPSTNANYSEAWKVLIKRYQNPRVIVNAHINTLFGLKHVQGDIPTSLRHLLDTTVENIRALNVLGEATDQWNSILIHLVTSKLDMETRRNWELSLTDTAMPTFDQLQEFLEQRCRALEAAADHKPIKASGRVNTQSKQAAVHHITQQTCEFCKLDHLPFKCDLFLRASLSERIEMTKAKTLCFNCLRPGHQSQACRSSSCRKCNKRHNTLLHRDLATTPQAPVTAAIKATVDNTLTTCVGEVQAETHVLLATALILVKDSSGSYQQCRALLDSGSQASFLTENCMKRLRLKRHFTNTSIKALGQLHGTTSRGAVVCHFTSSDSKYGYMMDALVLPKITGLLPQRVQNPSSWSHIKDLDLADPTFFQPGEIDILLGADVYAELTLAGKRKGPVGTPTAQQTTLGWVLSGCVSSGLPALQVNSHHVTLDLDTHIRRFWEMEELPGTKMLTPEERLCETHFSETHSRDTTGRFTVRLPINPNATQELGESKTKAAIRLRYMETRFKQHPHLYVQYREFMQDYVKLGHMSKVTDSHDSHCIPYYIPHHAVHKEESTTTKLRVVFDASSKTTTGVSLNEKLLVGPTVQDSLMALVLRFRIYPFVFMADLAKMFRQVCVHKQDRHYQRILWRDSPQDPVDEYELNTVTYGTACGTYLATKVLQQLAIDEVEQFPLGAQVLKTDFYVDDLMSGAMTKAEAVSIQTQLIALLDRGGFELRKWTANDPGLLSHLPPELRATDESFALAFDSMVKTLGLHWHPRSDHFTFHLQATVCPAVTKRTILSITSQLFDPLGWLSPFVIRPKILMQRLWLAGVSWDDPTPADITKDWMDIWSELSLIQTVQIPRHVGLASWVDRCELHGFCDSSEAAYAAVVYIRTINTDGAILSRMLCSKTRVAPLKQLSLPRLELCGAHLLARLLNVVVGIMKFTFAHVHAWTDSTVVLAWLAAQPRRWTTFVANRVALIQELIPPQDWSHVASKDNPADCASRGLSVEQLINSPLWWNGPHWLLQDASSWRTRAGPGSVEDTVVELRASRVVLAATTFPEVLPILQKYSSLTTLLRVTAYCSRFIHNCRLQKRSERRLGPINTQELNDACHYWIKVIQHDNFKAEVSQLQNHKAIAPTSRILPLNPFIDHAGVLRVGGRLKNSTLQFDQRHPILVPQRCQFTLLLIRHEHLRNLHAGPQLLLSIIRNKYWIPNGRNVVRAIVQKCVVCHRHRAQISRQLMGNLPACRIQPARPFERVGIDYGGPINIRLSRLRGGGARRTSKAYIALLVCMVTKAIHLELVVGLTTEALLATLQRFMARRGKPAQIYSDCATNFKGADSELGRLHNLARGDKLQNHLTSEGVSWNFIPPGSPHFGGLWEAGIKSTKSHLMRVMGTSTLTFEELYTLLTQIEACLNSRPLCPLSADPGDFEALTPGHFLIGQALTKPPEAQLACAPRSHLAHWQQVQYLYQSFWRQWSSEYLVRLQQRPKWASVQPNLKVGKLVLLKDKDLPPLKWSLARVLEIHPGSDNLVRVVTLRTAKGTFKRAISNISPLPFEE